MRLKIIPALVLCLASTIFAADGTKTIRGNVEKVDAVGKVVEIRTPDRVLYQVTVVEAEETDAPKSHGALLRGITKGTAVVASGVAEGAKFTAHELYRVGKGGLEVTTAVVRDIGEGGKFLVVNTAKGGEETFHLAGEALREVARGTEKGTKVVIYSTEKAGKKVAHFFETVV